MKPNILNVILKNLLSFLAILILFEIAAFSFESHKVYQEEEKSAGFISTDRLKYSFKINDFDCNESFFRPIEKEGNKHSIILFGCSFTYGYRFGDNDEEKTFAHKLAKATNGTVYNRAFPGWGAQHILYQLKRKDFYEKVENPDYIIYTFIDDHINRLNNHQWGGFWTNTVNLRYKEKNGDFTEIKPQFKPLWFLFTVKELQYCRECKLNSPENYSKNFDSYSLIMKESLRLAKSHYPNVKFVILVYSPCIDLTPEKIEKFKKLEQDGFIVLKTDDFVKENLRDGIYHYGEDPHPTAKAWEVIVPALVKKLNL